MIIEWFEYVGDVGGRLLALLCLFEGARRITVTGVHRTGVLFLGFGTFLCLAYGGMAYWKHSMLTDASKVLERNVLSAHLPLADDWGTACCSDKRESSSLAMVRAAFLESGTLYTYFDSAGARKLFAPSQEDIKKREGIALSNAKIKESTGALLSEAVYWLVASIFALLLGFAIGRELRSVPANNTVEPDARKDSARGSP
jgi:hypothetical protein